MTVSEIMEGGGVWVLRGLSTYLPHSIQEWIYSIPFPDGNYEGVLIFGFFNPKGFSLGQAYKARPSS